MAFCRLVLALLATSVASTYGKVQVPVFLWGDFAASIASNPLSSVTEDDFGVILQKGLKNEPFTVIFIDETLSVEDLSLKDDEGETIFPYLHANIGKAVYLPSVENSLEVLDRMADTKKVDRVKVDGKGLSAEILRQNVQTLVISLEDALEGESRADLLRRHNDFMQETLTKLKEEYGNVVAIYTAKNPSWTVSESHLRYRRQAQGTEIQNATLEGLKLYVDRIVVTMDNTVDNMTSIDSTSTEFNGTEMATVLTSGDNSLTLNFLQKAGYWFFSKYYSLSYL